MKVEKHIENGIEFHRFLVGGRGNFWTIENGKLFGYDTNPRLRNLVLLEINGRIDTDEELRYRIFVRTDGKIRPSRLSFSSRAEAEKAARNVAGFFEKTYVVDVNRKQPEVLTHEDDPEAFDRDFYEDQGISRNMHPEQNT